MTVIIKFINSFLMCILVLCDITAEINLSSVTSKYTTVNSRGPIWPYDNQLSAESTTSDVIAVQPCHHYYEYCTNPNTTYKFQANLKGKQMTFYGPRQLNYKDYVKARCFCDRDCHSYGDCCYDQLTIDNNTGEPIHLKHSIIQWECRRVPFIIKGIKFEAIDIMLVASCPSHYKDVNVIRWCQHDNVPPSQYHYSMDVPVLSRTTNRTYVNIYCALCNSDTKVHRFTTTFYCPVDVPKCYQEKQWTYARGENRWIIRRNDSDYDITYDIVIDTNGQSFYDKFNARKCRSDVIRSCPAHWTDVKTRQLCSAYSLLVRSKSNMEIYKNEHCALCNGQNRSQLTCPRVGLNAPRQEDALAIQPFSVLIDFFGDGNVGRNRPGCNGEFCKFGEICDQLFGKCRAYTCGELFYMNSDGNCVLNNVTVPDSKSTYLNDSCPKFHVHQPHYVMLPNNSIYVNLTSKIYLFNEHEVVNETTVLVCDYNAFYNFGKFTDGQSILSAIGVSISLLCLAVHIFIYLILPQLQNIHGMIVLSLSSCLFVAQLLFQFGIRLENAFSACVAIGVTIHFGFLSSFFWMNILAIDMYRTFAFNSYQSLNYGVWEKYKKYALYAWLSPLVIVLLALINDLIPYVQPLQPNYGKDLCWINNRNALLMYFAGPLGILLLINIGLFLMTVVNFQKGAEVSKMARENSSARDKGIANDRTRVILYTKLAVIMGLTWIFGFVAALTNATVLWYVFIIFNSLQGAFIFISFSCKQSTFQQLHAKLLQVIGRKRNLKKEKSVSSQTQLTAVTPSKASEELKNSYEDLQ